MSKISCFSSSILKVTASFTAMLSLAACSTEPLSSVTSLAPAIQGAAISDDDALADSSDQILLYNILRARDRRTLDLGTLSSFSATLSLSGTAGFSIPFGPKTSTSNTATPSVTASTSPTYAFTPLNNQGFTTAILQPVSAAYVENRWNAGVSPELLLLLFVKNISFPVTEHGRVSYIRYANDPDSMPQFEAFKRTIEILLRHNAELKTFDIMDPVGPEFPFMSPTAGPQPNSTAYGFVTGANDAPYHAGNAGDQSTGSKGQLYRVYSGQIALCVPADKMRAEGFNVRSLKTPAATKKHTPTEKEVAQSYSDQIGHQLLSAPYALQGLSVTPNLMTTTKSASGTSSTSTSTTTTPNNTPGTTAILQAGRYSSVVDSAGCAVSEIVLQRTAEEDFAKNTDGFVHIEWRSVSEIFEYLGAVLRSQDTVPDMTTWLNRNPAFVALGDESAMQALERTLSYRPGLEDSSSSPDRNRLFVLHSDADFLVKYMGTSYGVAANNKADHTREVLAMLGTLVNLANGSTAASSQPLQLLPIP